MTTTYNFNQRAYSQPSEVPDNWYDEFTSVTQPNRQHKARPHESASPNVSLSKRTLAAIALTTVGAGAALGLLAFNLAGTSSEPARTTTVYPNYSVYPQLQVPTVTTPPAPATTIVDVPAAAPGGPATQAPADPAPAASVTDPEPAPAADNPAPEPQPAPEPDPKPHVIPIPIPAPIPVPIPAPIPVPIPVPSQSGNPGGQSGNPGGNGSQSGNPGGNGSQNGGNSNQGGQGSQDQGAFVPPVVINAPKPGTDYTKP
jgi:uncharacterized membrane protein YgcG